MARLIIHPEQHHRFPGTSVDSVIAVCLDDENGDASGYFVELSVEPTEYEIGGPKRGETNDLGEPLDRGSHYAARGEDLTRQLDPDEARALAAALWHFADLADRRRAR